MLFIFYTIRAGMLRLLQQNKIFLQSIIFLYLIGIVIFLPVGNTTATIPLLGNHIEIQWYPWFSKLAAVVLVWFTGFLMVRLSNEYNFIRERTYMPALFYALFVFPVLRYAHIEPSLFVAIIMVIILSLVIESYRTKGISYHYFYTGLLLGLGALLYFPMVLYVVLVYIAYVLLRQMNIREILFPIIGIAVVYYLVWGIFYVFGWSLHPMYGYISTIFQPDDYKPTWNLVEKIYLINVGIIVLISSLYMGGRFFGKKVYSRRIYIIFWWLFIISLALFFLIPTVRYELVYILAIPVSFLVSHYFINVRPTVINEIILLIFISLSVLATFF